MELQALATDYDGTLATLGCVDERTWRALRELKSSGRMLILVTGRRLGDLIEVFPGYGIFDRIVAENGALLYDPLSRKERLLAAAPPPEFVRALEARGVTPLEVGRSIVATLVRNERIVMDTMIELGIGMVPILNKESLMLLPPGVNKATGLRAALAELAIDASGVVGVGDAENDLDLILNCGIGAAVANAVPELKRAAQIHLTEESGSGVVELIETMLFEATTAKPSA
ncbi:MAG TPA: HAD family hydrolase [Bdellovibrionota bacterium]|nr:HAD family hydrolase [Bdellovibrionota bacterium]